MPWWRARTTARLRRRCGLPVLVAGVLLLSALVAAPASAATAEAAHPGDAASWWQRFWHRTGGQASPAPTRSSRLSGRANICAPLPRHCWAQASGTCCQTLVVMALQLSQWFRAGGSR